MMSFGCSFSLRQSERSVKTGLVGETPKWSLDSGGGKYIWDKGFETYELHEKNRQKRHPTA